MDFVRLKRIRCQERISLISQQHPTNRHTCVRSLSCCRRHSRWASATAPGRLGVLRPPWHGDRGALRRRLAHRRLLLRSVAPGAVVGISGADAVACPGPHPAAGLEVPREVCAGLHG